MTARTAILLLVIAGALIALDEVLVWWLGIVPEHRHVVVTRTP